MEPRQTEETLELPGVDPPRLRYLRYAPSHPDAGPAPWPLIVFLHGSGERGDDLALVKQEGLPRLLDGLTRFPFVVVSPQCPSGREWSIPALDVFVARLVETLPVDPRRVSLAGLSSGARAALELAARHPGRFAAVVAVAVPGLPPDPCGLKGTSVRIFHNEGDGRIPARTARRAADRLRSCGVDVTLTLFPDEGHDAWTRAFSSRPLYEWLERTRSGTRALPHGGS